MKKILTLLSAALVAVSAFGQAYEFRYNGAADVIFSYPPRGAGGRAFVHDMNNVLTINYEGDFTNGVKIGRSFWVSNNGMLNTWGDAGIGTSTIENVEGWSRVFQVQGDGHAKAIVTTNNVQSGLWSHDLGWYGALAGGIVGTRTNHPFSIITNQSAKMTILPNGNTGIGTSNPQDKLSVKGKIRAEEVKVTTSAVDWPDYVFKPGYAMLSLQEIEKYIHENGHLPDVPTAGKVEKDGLSLGEMNKILLKKIEEMTLHLIEKDKIINHVMERLEKLESAK